MLLITKIIIDNVMICQGHDNLLFCYFLIFQTFFLKIEAIFIFFVYIGYEHIKSRPCTDRKSA